MKIALAMMSRDPVDVVARAVASALPFIDRLVLVVAPGSPLMGATLPIETRIIEHVWQGYARTRTAALRYAEEDPAVDWVMMLDARSTISGRLPTAAEAHDVDAFEIAVEDVASRWRWMRGGHLMRARRGIDWAGTGGSDLHEAMRVPAGGVVLQWPHLVLRGEPSPKPSGAARTYESDVHRLAEAHARHPNDTRTAFYLAQSLKDAGFYAQAFEVFQRRAGMPGGYDEETFWALLWAAKLAPFVGEDAAPLYLAAHERFPDRAEPFAGLAAHYQGIDAERAEAMRARADACPYPIAARSFVDLNAYSDHALAAAGITT